MADTLLTDAATTSEGTTTQQSATTTGAPGTDTAGSTTQQSTQAQDTTTSQDAGDGATTDSNTDADKTPAGAPEKYEFQFTDGTAPDGETLAEFEGIAKELNLSQADAQKIADIGPKLAAKWQAHQQEAFQKTLGEWVSSAQADKEFGGEKFAENLAMAKKSMDQFGTPELRTLLNQSGLGNNPEIIRAFYRAGKAISEDNFVGAGANRDGAGGKSAAEILYDNQGVK